MRTISGFLFSIAVISLGLVSPPVSAQTEYITKEMLNLDTIRQEEHMPENSQLTCLYLSGGARSSRGKFTIYYPAAFGA